MRKRHNDLADGLQLAEVARLDGESLEEAIERRPETRNSRPTMMTADPDPDDTGIVGDQGNQRRGDHDLVRQRVQQHAHGGDLAMLASQIAVQPSVMEAKTTAQTPESPACRAVPARGSWRQYP